MLNYEITMKFKGSSLDKDSTTFGTVKPGEAAHPCRYGRQ